MFADESSLPPDIDVDSQEIELEGGVGNGDNIVLGLASKVTFMVGHGANNSDCGIGICGKFILGSKAVCVGGTVTTDTGDIGGVLACDIVTVVREGGGIIMVLGVAGATATIAGHCLNFRSCRFLCWEAALLGKGSVGSVMDMEGVCILPIGASLLDLLVHPRNNKEDRICAGIVVGTECTAVEAAG